MNIYKKVDQLCREFGINVTQLEKQLGFGTSTIQKWDTAMPRIDKIVKVAQYFNVSVDWLVGLSNVRIKNIWMESRKVADPFYPLEDRLGPTHAQTTDILMIRIMNLAGTSIVLPDYVAPNMNTIKQYVDNALTLGAALEMIITDPNSYAAKDAAVKMFNPYMINQVDTIKISYDKIRTMMSKDSLYKTAYNSMPRRFQAYTTDIVMPYSIMQIVYKPESASKNHIKVDLYSPNLDQDSDRRTFLIYETEDSENYQFFESSYFKIRKTAKPLEPEIC